MKQDRQAVFEKTLGDRLQGEVTFDKVTRAIYATDASMYQIMPVAVVLPHHEADVRAAVETAREFEVPILPRGGGTSLGGQTVGPSMVIDFSKYMNKVLELNVEVLGISADNPFSQKAFAASQGLPYPLLSDMYLKVTKAYGVLYGETGAKFDPGFKGRIPGRAFFLVDKHGVIRGKWIGEDLVVFSNDDLLKAARKIAGNP